MGKKKSTEDAEAPEVKKPKQTHATCTTCGNLTALGKRCGVDGTVAHG